MSSSAKSATHCRRSSACHVIGLRGVAVSAMPTQTMTNEPANCKASCGFTTAVSRLALVNRWSETARTSDSIASGVLVRAAM